MVFVTIVIRTQRLRITAEGFYKVMHLLERTWSLIMQTIALSLNDLFKS